MNKLPPIGQTNGDWYRRSFFRVDVIEGAEFPWGFGLSYIDYFSRMGVTYPLILNWIVWGFRELYFIIVSTPNGGIERKSYILGKQEGEKSFQSREYLKLVEFVKSQYKENADE